MKIVVSTMVHSAIAINNIFFIFQTLCAITSAVYKTSGQCGFDVIDILLGFDTAEQRMKLLLNHCNNLLSGNLLNIFKYVLCSILKILCYLENNYY